MGSYLDDPQRWRDRAEEARIQADQMRDDDTRKMMLGIATAYEKMAERAEERIAAAGVSEVEE